MSQVETLLMRFIVYIFQAVDNPSYAEIRDVCAAAGLTVGVEVSTDRMRNIHLHSKTCKKQTAMMPFE